MQRSAYLMEKVSLSVWELIREGLIQGEIWYCIKIKTLKIHKTLFSANAIKLRKL